MNAIFKKGIVFRRIIECIRECITEGAFVCRSDSITLQAMDTSHVALVSMYLDGTAGFQEYSCSEDFFMGVSIPNLYKILKCMDPEDTLSLSADPDTPTLSIEFEHPNRMSCFEMYLIDLDADHLDIPEQEYDCNLKLSSSEFKRIISDLNAFGESIFLNATQDGFSFSVKDHANITLKNPEEYICRSDTIAEFSLRFLSLFSKAQVLSKSVVLKFSTNTPLMVEFSFEEGWTRFYLSPKIIDD